MVAELFWEEVELRRLLSSAKSLAEEVRSGSGGVDLLCRVVETGNRRLEDLRRGNQGWRGGQLGYPSSITLSEYARRLREAETELREVAQLSTSRGPPAPEVVGMRRRPGPTVGRPPQDARAAKSSDAQVDKQAQIQEELMDMLLVRVTEMRQGAERLHDKIKESSEAVDDVDQLIDSNLNNVSHLRGDLKKYERASWFQSLGMWMAAAVAIVVWVLVFMFILTVR